MKREDEYKLRSLIIIILMLVPMFGFPDLLAIFCASFMGFILLLTLYFLEIERNKNE